MTMSAKWFLCGCEATSRHLPGCKSLPGCLEASYLLAASRESMQSRQIFKKYPRQKNSKVWRKVWRKTAKPITAQTTRNHDARQSFANFAWIAWIAWMQGQGAAHGVLPLGGRRATR